jgi:hypothetical protein
MRFASRHSVKVYASWGMWTREILPLSIDTEKESQIVSLSLLPDLCVFRL